MSATVVNEAANAAQTVTFGSGDDAVTLIVPKKWKRFKLLRAINSGDILGALEAAFGAEQVALLDDVDVDESEFLTALESLALALGGTSQGN